MIICLFPLSNPSLNNICLASKNYPLYLWNTLIYKFTFSIDHLSEAQLLNALQDFTKRPQTNHSATPDNEKLLRLLDAGFAIHSNLKIVYDAYEPSQEYKDKYEIIDRGVLSVWEYTRPVLVLEHVSRHYGPKLIEEIDEFARVEREKKGKVKPRLLRMLDLL